MIDSIQGYYWKRLESVRDRLVIVFNEWLDTPENIPIEMLTGRTILIHKGGDSKKAENYRPITCLNVIMKIFTSIIKRKIEEQLANNEYKYQISKSQYGNKKGSLAAKEISTDY